MDGDSTLIDARPGGVAHKHLWPNKMQDDIPTIACPCGYRHRLLPPPGDGFVTIRDKDWLTVLDNALACREISGSWAAIVPESNPRHEEHSELTWKIVERCGSLLQCPQCGRLRWHRPGEGGEWINEIFGPESPSQA